MHWVERHILKKLAFADELRYSELLPDGVEGNLFQYHARQLERSGLIERHKQGYRLSLAGRQFVADLSQTKQMNRRQFPRPLVMVAAEQNGQWLLFRWKRQPYRGLISLPFGRWTAGQSASDMAAEQLLYKSGYTADLVFAGTISIAGEQDHQLILVFKAGNLKQTNEPDGLTGEFFWSGTIPGANEAVFGTAEIISWLSSSSRPSFLELNLGR